jgi:hypothetical protein
MRISHIPIADVDVLWLLDTRRQLGKRQVTWLSLHTYHSMLIHKITRNASSSRMPDPKFCQCPCCHWHFQNILGIGVFALLVCYVAQEGSDLPTFRDSLSVPSPLVKQYAWIVWPMEMGSIGCTETSAKTTNLRHVKSQKNEDKLHRHRTRSILWRFFINFMKSYRSWNQCLRIVFFHRFDHTAVCLLTIWSLMATIVAVPPS